MAPRGPNLISVVTASEECGGASAGTEASGEVMDLRSVAQRFTTG